MNTQSCSFNLTMLGLCIILVLISVANIIAFVFDRLGIYLVSFAPFTTYFMSAAGA
jgi:hypothetical protein